MSEIPSRRTGRCCHLRIDSRCRGVRSVEFCRLTGVSCGSNFRSFAHSPALETDANRRSYRFAIRMKERRELLVGEGGFGTGTYAVAGYRHSFVRVLSPSGSALRGELPELQRKPQVHGLAIRMIEDNDETRGQ